MSAIKEAMIMIEELDEYLTSAWIPVGDHARRININGEMTTVSVGRSESGRLAYMTIVGRVPFSASQTFMGESDPKDLAEFLRYRGLPVASDV